jgi:HSP20 family protein
VEDIMARKSSGAQRPRRRKASQHAAPRPPSVRSGTRGGALNPFEPMERLAKAFMPFGWFMPWLEVRTPRMDIIESERAVVIRAECPGVDKKALNIEVGDHSVTIEGSAHHESVDDNGAYFRSEITRGSFSRTVTLPAPVDRAKARADFKDGMLIVTLPKADLHKAGTVKVGRID